MIRFLCRINPGSRLVAGVRNVEKAKGEFKDYPHLEFIHFDFENVDTFDHALKGIDRLFLLRPPHISDVEKYFRPLIAAIKKNNIRELVFLSVQGHRSAESEF